MNLVSMRTPSTGDIDVEIGSNGLPEHVAWGEEHDGETTRSSWEAFVDTFGDEVAVVVLDYVAKTLAKRSHSESA